MNNTLAIETIPTAGFGRIRAAIAALASSRRPELTREELAQLHEQGRMAQRLLDDARTSVYTTRAF